MFGKLLNKLTKSSKLESHPKFDPLIEAVEQYDHDRDRSVYDNSRIPFKDCDAYKALKSLPMSDKVEAILHLAHRTNVKFNKTIFGTSTIETWDYRINRNLLDALMRTRIDFPVDFSFAGLFDVMYGTDSFLERSPQLYDRPFSGLVMQIEKHAKRHGFNERLRSDIQTILNHSVVQKYLTGERTAYGVADIGKAAKKLQQLLRNEGDAGSELALIPYHLGSGRFGSIIDADRASMPIDKQAQWNALFHHLSSANAGKPSVKFITAANQMVDAIGKDAFKSQVINWLQAASNLSIEQLNHTNTYNGRTYNYSSYEFIEAHSFNLLKGMLWTMSRFHDAQSLQIIALLVEKCFKKIPEQGPAAPAVGNAGIYALAQSKGLAGISHLSRLKLRIRQNNTQKLIQKYIDEQAEKQGLKPTQIEELAAPDYGLTDGEYTEKFEDHHLVLRLTGIGAAELQWLKPDGSPQKTVPAFVKNSKKHSAKLKKLRDLAKQLKQSSTAQRDRIDRLYTEDMDWSLADFEKYYLNHGVISQIARNLIWTLDGTPALFISGQWQDVQGDTITPSSETQVRLWHPIDSDPENVLAWREKLEALQIKQPLKQAHREIYLLTDAEIDTRVYSNRMAANILKQHQFNALAALRGWKYSLLGAYDDGRDGEIARKLLPSYGLEAQFWINEILDDNDSFNDAGIWFYVVTDQLRFHNVEDQPVPLVEIPPLILSEIMRDVDLFVGVASVGNDPQWQDGGPEGRQDYREYWQSYSFGDLTQVAKTRKEVLERLLPRLKIRNVAHVEGRFLIVDGKRHTYKIHIGSGNILIAPNDRYLCIVPGRGKDKYLEQVFLPFEGDNGLSIVLSKAFLLAADDEIKDATILSQL